MVNASARTTPAVAKGVRSAGYGKARAFALEHEQITPESLADSCEIERAAARRLCGQLERDGVLNRILAPDQTPVLEPSTNAEVILEELCLAFEPENPYHIAQGVFARTPHEMAALCMAGKWGEAPPPLFVAACARWQNGFLEAWLRQRLPANDAKAHALLEQIARHREDAAKDENPEFAWALFDAILRIFDPKLAPLAFEWEWSPSPILVAPWGKTVARQLHWRVRGAGIALGALELTGALAGLEMGEHLVCGRAGKVEISLRGGGGDLVAGRHYLAHVTLRSQNARAAKALASLQYRVDFPREETRNRVWLGAAIGMASLGLPRLIVMTGELSGPANANGLDYNAIWEQTSAGQWPHLGLLCATILLLGGLYGAFRAWLWALRNWGAA